MTAGPYSEILIVEDDPSIARSLKDGLEREGFRTIWKVTGVEGLAASRQQTRPPHLILLDVRLPDCSGFDLCRQIRQAGLRQPIIMLTVQGEETDKVLGLEMGADDYLTKPFSLRELVSRIRAQLRRAYGELSNAEAELLYVRDLVIDVGRGQILRGDQAISLTPTEFRLLVYLAHHRGQAITRGQIIEAVWGFSAGMESERAVNVNIHRLREKIELNPSRPDLILTVPGIGYRLAG